MAPKKPGAAPAAQDAVDPLPALFDEVLRFAQQDDNERVAKAADKILKIVSDDGDALAAKLIALIKLDKYADAMAMVGDFPAGLRRQFEFEEAYCLYRLNKHDEALTLMDRSEASGTNDEAASARMEQLRAQVAYKKEDYSMALDVTRRLVEQVPANELQSSEYLTNFLAALAGLVLASGQVPADALAGISLPRKDSMQLTYETAYNLGCYFASLGEWERSVGWLELARGIGRKALQDDSSGDDQLQQDLATIAVELAYVYQKQGRKTEAAELCHDILRTKITEPLLTALASSNILSARGPSQDLLGSAKRFKGAMSAQALAKLAEYQKRPMELNNVLVGLWTNKPAECKAKVQELAEKYPEDDVVAAVQAGLAALERKPQKAVEALREALSKRPSSLRLAFSLTQLLSEQGDAGSALDTLLPVFEDQLKNARGGVQPGLVNLVLSLLEKKGDSDKALKVLEDSLKSWKVKQPSLSQGPFLRTLADLKMKAGRLQDAAGDLEALHSQDAAEAQTIAGLVTIYSKLDPAKASRFEALLPATGIENDAARIDVDQLEELLRRPSKNARTGGQAVTPVSPSGAVTGKPKKSRKRKRIIPKNYDPNAEPDPERWVPKTQRTTFARKGKKKMQMLKGPQGSSSTYAGAGSGMTGSARIAGFDQQRKDMSDDAGSGSPAEKTGEKAQDGAAKKAPPPQKKKKGKGKW